ncbi:MAG: hypothetical protein FE78DRAFT_93767 [Acidomyces sp. 'richmondensis']|nr:MAG: hypothetical protein FE78DRAFT_93767 [Acidomyces sp. 'richmondensis']
MGFKRSHADMEGHRKHVDGRDHDTRLQPQGHQRQSPFMPMFEYFRYELDEHHDRRERVITASREITRMSKKIIFTLQRIRTVQQPLPAHASKTNQPLHAAITSQFSSVSGDLQGINAYRYDKQISGGRQEWMESISFQYYLEHAKLIGFEEARVALREQSQPSTTVGAEQKHESMDVDTEEERTESDVAKLNSNIAVGLTPEDYLLGIYDMTGELMRFAITAMATNGSLPAISTPIGQDFQQQEHRRTVLTDMRELRSALESFDAGTGPFAKDAEKKMEVMKGSVEKVERALYGLTVRGAERPKGWMPEINEASLEVGAS